ncbi:MAG: phosphoesterase [Planctomycetales bacterium]|nr:phosphoesterase [Planctomycetales bacterium]NIM08733.1 phosphoesterase [Planctomycetales bacterium]NIN08203.1 phosphoesterase [Planctomycetales bacterium]NIN77331.1 phosphoesterase [Planctomycetales bacterium]NIO34515.1 phosphoesterase [Planctomycetales bacterium]
MRALWLTDIHLNFVDNRGVKILLDRVQRQQADAVLLTGDVGESHSLLPYLAQMNDAWDCPIYFVLGNHDFYFGSIERLREEVQRFCQSQPQLSYLTSLEIEELTPRIGLIGHDGWADGRIGDYERSIVMMNDYRLIHELAPFKKEERLAVLHALGDEAAAHVRRVLPQALDTYGEVVFLTHVPPLREACWYEGQLSDDEWAPHFTCKAIGDALLDIMPDYPDHHLTVLCGHTHSRGETHPLPNLEIRTGAADYGKPDIEQIFSFP